METVTLSSINSIGCGHALAKLASREKRDDGEKFYKLDTDCSARDMY